MSRERKLSVAGSEASESDVEPELHPSSAPLRRPDLSLSPSRGRTTPLSPSRLSPTTIPASNSSTTSTTSTEDSTDDLAGSSSRNPSPVKTSTSLPTVSPRSNARINISLRKSNSNSSNSSSTSSSSSSSSSHSKMTLPPFTIGNFSSEFSHSAPRRRKLPVSASTAGPAPSAAAGESPHSLSPITFRHKSRRSRDNSTTKSASPPPHRQLDRLTSLSASQDARLQSSSSSSGGDAPRGYSSPPPFQRSDPLKKRRSNSQNRPSQTTSRSHFIRGGAEFSYAESDPVGLPDEIWSYVIAYLDINTAIKTSMAGPFWQGYTFRHIASLDFKRFSKMPKDVFGKLVRRTTRAQSERAALRELKIDTKKLESPEEGQVLFYYLSRLVGLRKLHLLNLGLGKVDMTDDQFRRLKTLTNIVSLDLTNYGGIGPVMDMLPSFLKLERLYLKETSKHKSGHRMSQQLLFLSTLTNLRTLQIVGFRAAEAKHYDFLTVLTILEDLCLLECPHGTDTLTSSLSKLTNLTTFKYSEHQSSLISPLINVSKLVRLTKMYIRYGYHINDQLLSQLRHCPTVTCLHISSCFRITAEGVRVAISGMPNLQTLRVRWSTDIKSLVFLKNANNLTELDLGGLFHIVDAQTIILRKLGHLRSINLSRHQFITDATLENLCNLPHLHTVNLSGCTHITTKGIGLLSSLQKLNVLNISGCSGVSTHRFMLPFWKKNLLPQMPDLKILTNVYDSVDISDHLFRARLNISGL